MILLNQYFSLAPPFSIIATAWYYNVFVFICVLFVLPCRVVPCESLSCIFIILFFNFQVPDELLEEAKAAARAALEEMDAD